MRGSWCSAATDSSFNFDRASITKAREYFEQAIELDAGYARACCGLAWSYHRELWLDRSIFAGEMKKSFVDAAKRAALLDEFDAEAHNILSMAYNWHRESDHSLAEAQRAVELNPNNAQAHELLGAALTLVGRPNEGIASQKLALLLSPRDPRHGVWMWSIGLSYLTARQYEDAVLWCERAIQRHAANPDAHLVLASSLGHLGRVAEAGGALDATRRLAPGKSGPFGISIHGRTSTMPTQHFRDGIARRNKNLIRHRMTGRSRSIAGAGPGRPRRGGAIWRAQACR